MEGQDIRGLFEAYSQVYETPEVLNEEVEDLQEIGVNFGGQAAVDRVRAQAAAERKSAARIDALRQQRFGSGGSPSAKGSGGTRYGTGDTYGGPRPGIPAKPVAPTKPAAPTSPAKPSPTAGQKPTAPTPPAKPAGSAMDQWAKANPKLAAAAAEKARIRGTSQTDNPLMKDMRSKMSMTPSVQSPTLAKDLGKSGGNQSLLNNPNASKAATPKPVNTKPTAGPKFNPNASAPPEDLIKKTSAVAATSTPTPVAPKPKLSARSQALHSPGGAANVPDRPQPVARRISDEKASAAILKQDLDIFDLVKGHLLDEGYAETEQNAIVMMANMSEEWRDSILESHGVDLEETKKWIQKAIKHPGSLSKQLGVPEEENIPMSKLKAAAKKGGTLGKRANLAMTLKGLHKEELEQLDEISLKTKMKAYAASRDVDSDYVYGSKVHDQGDRIKANIEKKHGKEAGEHAERHAEVSNFGRRDASGKRKGLPKSRIEKSDYRTTDSGKMHKQDQSELKRELRIRRGKKLRAADADDDN